MTLLKDFYTTIDTNEIAENRFVVTLALNAAHPIFRGHFPNNPVTPGVCMMQIIKESTEKILQQPLQLIKLSNVKFMAIINPEKNPKLFLELSISNEEDQVKVKNVTKFDQTVALKFFGEYKKVKI
ncbi:3-hydroxyacyl-ACP dehydratase [Vaginella massiliensis]|uniref:3-hydroxyacyl-ACP dehydratase n=1 Tax=Vaginella massiliensis TaxID=1816680 RepID=UPI0037503F33